MKINEIMFSDRELALMNKDKDMLKLSDKNTGPYAGISADDRAALKADNKAQAKLNAMMKKIKPPPYYLNQKEKQKWIDIRLAALEKAEADKRNAAAEKKLQAKKAKIDNDLVTISKPKKSQPLPAEPEDVKREVPSNAARHYMDRYWARYNDN
jgi:hypothetical protein